MRVGVFGTGNMGSGLGKAWAAEGHTVMLGSRDPRKAKTLAAAIGRGARGGSIEEAAAFGDAVLLAVPWLAVDETLEAAGPLDGKILIDCTNPLTPDEPMLLAGHAGSGAEQIAARVPGAKVVKAFSHVYSQIIHSSPVFGHFNASVFYCGDDAAAKEAVAGLAEAVGFDPVDAGSLRNARYLEPLAALMVQIACVVGQGTDQALKLIRR